MQDYRQSRRRDFLRLAAQSTLLLAPGLSGAQGAAAGPPATGAVVTGALQAGTPSRTALGAAMHRAAHQLYDKPLVLSDPLALDILGPQAAASLRADVPATRSQHSLRAYVVARSRYAEDMLTEAVSAGTGQYVVLGAGLDTFACRNPFADRLRIFEVDHPATQAWKRARLAEAGIRPPAGLEFAPVDFERETLAQGLARAGFAADRPAFASLLGVVMYLSRAAAMQTFRSVASWPRGSRLVLDYGLPDAALPADERRTRAQLASRVAAIGEPFVNWYQPEDLAAELRSAGFGFTRNLGPQDINGRYFEGRSDALHVSAGTHLMLAGV